MSEEQTATDEQLREALMNVVDPELHMNIVDLGLVYAAVVEGNVALVDMTLTSPGCPFGPYLVHQVQEAVMGVPGISDNRVEVVWEPPWGPDKMSEEARLELGFDL